ncbi:MAG: hypothetical protein LBI96_05595 [Odoribacteraceae bacterium]|nr:hypothetical protein [Odoribacteraceae bacterium]
MASTGSATGEVDSTSSATAVVGASTGSATVVAAVAELVEAQTTKANNHAPGAGADLQSVPTKGHPFRWWHGLQARASERVNTPRAHTWEGRTHRCAPTTFSDDS